MVASLYGFVLWPLHTWLRLGIRIGIGTVLCMSLSMSPALGLKSVQYGSNIAAAFQVCPHICPPLMCFRVFLFAAVRVMTGMHLQWAAITIALVAQSTTGKSAQLAMNRVFGTILGKYREIVGVVDNTSGHCLRIGFDCLRPSQF
jgi:hypothetical protein